MNGKFSSIYYFQSDVCDLALSMNVRFPQIFVFCSKMASSRLVSCCCILEFLGWSAMINSGSDNIWMWLGEQQSSIFLNLHETLSLWNVTNSSWQTRLSKHNKIQNSRDSLLLPPYFIGSTNTSTTACLVTKHILQRRLPTKTRSSSTITVVNYKSRDP